MKEQNDIELENTKNKLNKKSVKHFIIIVLYIIIVAIVLTMARAWAKYRTSKVNDASAEVAKWYFKVIGNGEQSADNIEFSLTRTDTNRLC